MDTATGFSLFPSQQTALRLLQVLQMIQSTYGTFRLSGQTSMVKVTLELGQRSWVTDVGTFF